MVVVPRSIAMPWIGPVERAISSPSSRMRSPSRVTAGSSAPLRPSGRPSACRSIRILPAAHGVAADDRALRSRPDCNPSLAGQAEIAVEMALLLGAAAQRTPCPRSPRRCTPCTCPACGRRWEPGCRARRRSRRVRCRRRAWVVCPLMVTAATNRPLASSSAFTAVGHFLGRALAIFFVAPLPLGEVVVGVLQAALRGQQVDPLHGSDRRHRQRDVVRVVLGLDLRGNFLPVENLVRRHGRPWPSPRAVRNRSTAAEAFAP